MAPGDLVTACAAGGRNPRQRLRRKRPEQFKAKEAKDKPFGQRRFRRRRSPPTNASTSSTPAR
ncbi:MAG TPA: hypothetical protein VFC23_08820, partial [Thermoanaerobaculia bacterium]|nr:hypothetical protein [Thermoanaerobaculia bacterium]